MFGLTPIETALVTMAWFALVYLGLNVIVRWWRRGKPGKPWDRRVDL